MIIRQQLETISRKTLKYPLQIAEKDYMLALVLQIISQSALGETLIFKGGTALHHCYLDQYRFSEDLDFSANKKKVDIEGVRNIFAGIDYLKIKKDYLSGATIKIEKLQYAGPLALPNSLKVEIDFLQNVVLPPQSLEYKNVWGVGFKVNAMDIREICAEKIRTTSDRARYRDFYDLFLILDKYKLDLQEIIGYIKQKEIRKPITKAGIKSNLGIVRTQKEADISQIYYSRIIADEDVEKMVSDLPFDEIA